MIYSIHGQELKKKWNTDLGGSIRSAFTLKDSILYGGTNQGMFFAIDASSGSKLWSYKCKGLISSSPALTEDGVLFEAGNKVYKLSYQGKVKWMFDPGLKPKTFILGSKRFQYQIDPFDFKRPDIVVKKDSVFFAAHNGTIYVLDVGNGILKDSISIPNGTAIRTTPLIWKDKIIFGDWNGTVHCYQLSDMTLVWNGKTFDYEKPYETFGGIVGHFEINDSILFFGARNNTVNALDADSGGILWSFIEEEGGWMWGDPLILEKTLYIGGSDNHSLYSFDLETGELIWCYKGNKNIVGKPILYNGEMAFTASNVYNLNEPGSLVFLDWESGTLERQFELEEGTIATPVQYLNSIILFGVNGNLFSFELN
ncbi:PQQ-binding-like beta-propeller repeat protein [Muricauda sp. CAU 1633]|uniref:outer membrane protein assembly factor BamB family protein n=1 Tax=Allomuricauda sp. CAU 1633 TaxID=2816036 RepID=UPI001A90C627|nr:PQQ-binding-like beta-propeller repeat protein [Muricauda sp. CAU 1633]MBO0321539.1 PQQ-binding-like beta-propeller repeat protein [Muricauda sp. CAU 1633]